ncbi:cbb3-type cytochrome c oxidase subunit II [Pelagicoccus sp. NFK12]|uniref:Cbb3-type cytochrome c oxidase subunit II n=1 Tax=Pelagicoccus enzymogenes TaxID=2773457 RepID=A0A927F5I9_9BACT|nr:cbb3-type cytochrome c oxidase subunit II [Pelagicoccus enzymogenes]MBD5778420.1 cbb3-type cytochrome c oxidase subunit II [Pelagicoccus enzymogenes]MDQ8197219.1 cbb3-type cytochrome c oxidase subunit II [Pelagicoccus enzymogenes]
MNRGPFIFIGVLIIVSLSWAVTLVKPIQEGGNLSPIGKGADRVPTLVEGLALRGREVYQEQGCVNCHTQQTIAVTGTDIERGWGDRQSMPLDYIDQSPVFTGYNRVGPDLANVGTRRTEAGWHYLHFYNPEITSPGSNMPPFAFLFEKRKIVGEASNRALDLPEGFRVEEGYEIVPSADADALVAYMLALSQAYEIEEAPTPEKLAYK